MFDFSGFMEHLPEGVVFNFFGSEVYDIYFEAVIVEGFYDYGIAWFDVGFLLWFVCL